MAIISANQQTADLPPPPKLPHVDFISEVTGQIAPEWEHWIRTLFQNWTLHVFQNLKKIQPTPPDSPNTGLPLPASVEGILAQATGRELPRQPVVSRETLLAEITGRFPVSAPLPALQSPFSTSPIPPFPGPPQIIVCTQATFPASGSVPAGTFVYVSDFFHLIFYDGTSFAFAGDPSDVYVLADTSPGPGWHACDGSTVNFLNADGTTSSKTLPLLNATKQHLAVGAGTGSLNAPVAPTLSGNTGNDSGVSVQAQPYATGVAVNVPAEPHTHPVGTLAVSTTGEPANYYTGLWFRL